MKNRVHDSGWFCHRDKPGGMGSRRADNYVDLRSCVEKLGQLLLRQDFESCRCSARFSWPPSRSATAVYRPATKSCRGTGNIVSARFGGCQTDSRKLLFFRNPYDSRKSKNRRRSDVSRLLHRAQSDAKVSRNDIELSRNDIERSRSVDFRSHSVDF